MAELVVVGDVVTDVLVSLSAPPQAGSDVEAAVTSRPGGQGANTAAWLARAGATVHLVGCVGADADGELLASGLEATGVCTHLVHHPTASTGTVVVLVTPDGERSMLTDRGANRGDLTVPTDLLDRVEHVHLSGYLLLDDASRATGLRILGAARAAGATTSVSASSRAPLDSAGAGAFLEWTAGVDLCLANREEAEVLTGLGDPAAAARRLADRYGAVAVTAGAEGAWWASRWDGVCSEAPAQADVVDTTGAGDAFAAGLLAALLDGEEPEAALRRGVGLAGEAVTTVGGGPPAQ